MFDKFGVYFHNPITINIFVIAIIAVSFYFGYRLAKIKYDQTKQKFISHIGVIHTYISVWCFLSLIDHDQYPGSEISKKILPVINPELYNIYASKNEENISIQLKYIQEVLLPSYEKRPIIPQ